MDEHESNRGAAEEASGVPATSAEDNGPASPMSEPGAHERARGDAEEKSGSPRTE
jgi:hypothetical protein